MQTTWKRQKKYSDYNELGLTSGYRRGSGLLAWTVSSTLSKPKRLRITYPVEMTASSWLGPVSAKGRDRRRKTFRAGPGEYSPRNAAQGRDADAALGGIQDSPPGRAHVHTVLPAVPGFPEAERRLYA